MLFDSHIHINSEHLSGWFEASKEYLGAWIFNNVSTNMEDFHIAFKQAKKNRNVFLTAGIHPLEIGGQDSERIMLLIKEKIRLFPKAIAIGETGLDFHRSPREAVFTDQKRWLLAHYRLAQEMNLPLVLHVRDAHEEMLQILTEEVDWKGVIHCFSGDIGIYRRYMELENWMISLSPIIFRDKENFIPIIKEMDLDRFMVESDAPYLTVNPTEDLEAIVKFIAEVRGCTEDEIYQRSFKNFYNLFNLKNIPCPPN